MTLPTEALAEARKRVLRHIRQFIDMAAGEAQRCARTGAHVSEAAIRDRYEKAAVSNAAESEVWREVLAALDWSDAEGTERQK